MTLRQSILLIISLSTTGCGIIDPIINDPGSIITTIEQSRWPTRARELSSTTEKKQLQKLLTNKGYNTKGIDGQIGPATIAEIKRYQKDNNLKVDGRATDTLLAHVVKNPSNFREKRDANQDEFTVAQCVNSNNKDVQAFTKRLLNSTLDDLEIDLDSYLRGFCVPEDKNQLARLYVFLVTEGVIHSRVAETKYNQLLAIYKKAGVVVAFNKDSYRRSTGDKLIEDIKISAQDRMDGATVLLKNSYQPEDNASFQDDIKAAYEKIPSNSPYKGQARQLLSEVLVHSTSSTFYLARSSYTIDQLTSYFGINLQDGVNAWEKTIILIRQLSTNMNLAFFLLSKQDDLLSMLVSSTYNIKALTEDVKDIPRLPAKVATTEVRKFKKDGGLTLDEMEINFDKDNTPHNFS